MKPRKTVYLLHRWIGLIVCVQLVAWSSGGLIFSLFDIRAVRGETETNDSILLLDQTDALTLSPAAAQQVALDAGINAIALSKITLRDRGLGPRYELYDRAGAPVGAVDPRTGEVVAPLTAAQAETLALADFVPDAVALQSTLIEQTTDSGEYRSKRTPAWRVDLDHPKRPHIYIDAVTGEVLARRNRVWRTYDFFWMLHIMDYKRRNNFNHPLLTAASGLAFLTGASGIWLWGWRARSRWKPKRQRLAA